MRITISHFKRFEMILIRFWIIFVCSAFHRADIMYVFYFHAFICSPFLCSTLRKAVTECYMTLLYFWHHFYSMTPGHGSNTNSNLCFAPWTCDLIWCQILAISECFNSNNLLNGLVNTEYRFVYPLEKFIHTQDWMKNLGTSEHFVFFHWCKLIQKYVCGL